MKLHFLSILSFLFLMIGVSSCSTTKTTTETDEALMADQARDLTNLLKARTGVHIIGSGSAAQITIRGFGSLTSTTEPLYVFDNQIISSYSNLYHLAAPSQIGKIEVLKTPDETGAWGMRGANGVIKVTSIDAMEQNDSVY